MHPLVGNKNAGCPAVCETFSTMWVNVMLRVCLHPVLHIELREWTFGRTFFNIYVTLCPFRFGPAHAISTHKLPTSLSIFQQLQEQRPYYSRWTTHKIKHTLARTSKDHQDLTPVHRFLQQFFFLLLSIRTPKRLMNFPHFSSSIPLNFSQRRFRCYVPFIHFVFTNFIRKNKL